MKQIRLLLLICCSIIASAIAAQDISQGVSKPSKYALKYSLATSAQKSTIWSLWSDVENWKDYDTIVEYSYLEDDADFVKGATGFVKTEGAPRSRFKLIEVHPGESFIEKLYVPLYQSIELHRYFEKTDTGTTIFSHEVRFKGRLRFITYAIAGGVFKKELPLVMGRLKALAEKREQELSD